MSHDETEPAAGFDRRLVCTEGTSDKFWNISCSGSLVTVEYGRTGTEGQIRTKDHGSSGAARRAADKLVAEKLRKGYSDASPVPAAASGSADGIEYFRAAAQEVVRPGFVTLDEALAGLLELADDDPAIPLSEAEAEAIVKEVWSERVAELADGRTGDDVRLEAAFQALRRAGYVAEMNLGYTKSDAWDEVGEQVAASPAKGLAYFHGQDRERLAFSPTDLYIGFDCVSGEAADMVEVGRAIVTALQAEGLRVEWDGTARTRVKVLGLDWRRPLPGSNPPPR